MNTQRANSRIDELKRQAKELESKDPHVDLETLMSEPTALLPAMESTRLKPKERLFSIAIARGLSMKEACAASGYTIQSGHELIEKLHILADIEKRTYALSRSRAITKDVLIAELFQLMEEHIDREERGSPKIVLACVELIAKMNGYFGPLQNINLQTGGGPIEIHIVEPTKPQDTPHELIQSDVDTSTSN